MYLVEFDTIYTRNLYRNVDVYGLAKMKFMLKVPTKRKRKKNVLTRTLSK